MTKARKKSDAPEGRVSRGRTRNDASFPSPPSRAGLPASYAALLGEIKQRIRTERLKTVLAANSAMMLLYWEIGRLILDRQEREGWGSKVIDRLSTDLREAFPDMSGLSPRNLKYMRAFADAWPEAAIVQRVVAQIPWRTNIALMNRLDAPDERLWYANQTIAHGWSQPVLCMQIESRLHERQGKAANNFAVALPPADSDMAALTLEEKLAGQKQIKALEAQCNQKRRSLFDVQDEVDRQREELIARIEGKLRQDEYLLPLFLIRWALV